MSESPETKLPQINGGSQHGSPAVRGGTDALVFQVASRGEDAVILGNNRRSVLPPNKQRQFEASKKSANVESRPAAETPKNGILTPVPPGGARGRPAPASAPSSSAGGDELVLLKKKLAKQNDRLASPVHNTPQRGTVANYQTPQSVRGHQYTTKPYESVPKRITWEPFNDDPDVQELNEKALRSEEKIQRLANQMEYTWSSRRPDASIPPPDPKVFSVPDSEVLPRAAAAESFAETGHLKYLSEVPILADDAGSFSISEMPESSAASPDRSAQGSRSGRQSTDNLTAEGLTRRASSVRVSKRTLGLLHALKMPSIDIVLPSPDDVKLDRNGDVLARNCILKTDLFEGLFTRRDKIGVMGGAPYFRMIPKFNIGGVAQASISGLQTCINEIFKVYSGTLIWVNLREEALTYINGRSFCIRSDFSPSEAIRNPGITGDRISAMEEKLVREVLDEASHCGGNVCVHNESANGKISLAWQAVDETSVTTMSNAISNLKLDSDCTIDYNRIPIPFDGIRVSQFDDIVNLCRKFPTHPVMVNCQTGRGKSTVAMIIFSIVRFYQHCDPNDVKMDASMLRGDGKSANFRTIMKLITLLHEGVVHERRVAMICELAGDLSNLRDRISLAFKEEVSEKAVALLRSYAYIVAFSCYCEALFWGTGAPGTTICRTFGDFLNECSEVKALIEGIRDANHQMAERVETPALAEASEDAEQDEAKKEAAAIKKEISNRHGSVLSSGMILRSYPTELAATSAIPGVVALRQLCPDVPYFTCGRNTETGMEDLIYNIREQFPKVKEIHWVNVRAEPSVYINAEPYIMLDGAAYTDEELASLHISGERIEEIEQRLKQDVIKEAEKRKGKIVVHKLHNDLNKSVPERLQVKRVQTPRAAKESTTSDVNLVYHRLPVPATDKIRMTDLTPMIQLFTQFEDDSAVILTDSGGGMRTTICLNVLTLVRGASKMNLRNCRRTLDIQNALAIPAGGRLQEDGTPAETPAQITGAAGYTGFYGGLDEKEASTLSGETIELHLGSQLSQMMTAGHLMKSLGYFIALGGRGVRWNILEAMDIHKRHSEQETGDSKKLSTFKAMCSAKVYLYMLIATIYIGESAPSFGETFDAWCERHPEIRNFFDKYTNKDSLLLKYVISSALPQKASIENRHGMVLATNFGIKADHFPGCQRKGMVPAISGAPNFRKVPHLNVYGVAIPTLRGVSNVLNTLGASDKSFYQYTQDPVEDNLHEVYPHGKLYARSSPDQEKPLRGRVLWVNLREEPIMYVADRPFVFRDLTNPYVNVELTGIETNKIQHVEDMLRQDVLEESEKYNGQFMVHDEGKPGELIGVWEPITEENVQTVETLYNNASELGDRVTFVRLPVTDESSPEIKDFDKLVAILLPEIIANMTMETQPLSMVFNCQMGRGRTTTGMVICCMLVGLTFPEYYSQLEEDYPELWPTDASEWERGNYSCITQLKGVLRDGSAAKRRVDFVLEACNRMQNLRSAIEMWKTMLESPDSNDEARGRAYHHGINYLQRYFMLLCFSSYLHDQFDEKSKSMKCSFEQWYTERDELRHIHDAAAMK